MRWKAQICQESSGFKLFTLIGALTWLRPETEAEKARRNEDMGTEERSWLWEQKAQHQIENELWQIVVRNSPLPGKSQR